MSSPIFRGAYDPLHKSESKQMVDLSITLGLRVPPSLFAAMGVDVQGARQG